MSTDRSLHFNIPWIFFLVALALLPFIIRSNYVITVMLMVSIFGVLSVGMGLLLGQAGMFSLAHPTWFGMGAYIAAILSVRGITSPFLSILVAAVCVAALSWLIGAPILRLRGFYLANATFAMIIIAQIAAGQLPKLTGGHEGLLGIPPLTIAGFAFKKDLHFYYLSWVLCLGCFWFCSNLMNSRLGRAIRSFHDNEAASSSLGVNIPRYKLQIFVLTAVMASLAGSLFCFYLRFVTPESFGFPLLVELIMMVIIGGIESIRGALLGSFVVLWLTEFIHAYLGKVLPVMTGEVDAIFFGLLIILFLIFMPRGLIGWIEPVLNLIGKKHGSESNPANPN
jgi:branched-chain amino acid transport system permease protein